MLVICVCGFLFCLVAPCRSSNVSDIESITPDLYILDANGNQRRMEDVALPHNSHVTLICRTAASMDSDLLWQFAVLDSNDFRPVVQSAYLSHDRSQRGETALRLTRVGFSMAGTYQCSNRVTSRQLNVHVYGILNSIGSMVQLIPKTEVAGSVHFRTYAFDPSSPPTVACQFRVGRSGIKYTSIRWRGGKFATNPRLYALAYSADELNGYIWSNLTVLHPTFDRELYGKYRCQFNIVPGSMESAEVEIMVPPVIKRVDHTVSYYTGKEFSHQCDVVAYPPIIGAVAWFRNEEPILLNDERNVYITGQDWGNNVHLETVVHHNDRIVFTSVSPEDRAVYSCFVRSDLGNATGFFFLRVKDRWAVFWPLIGIVLEIVILFIIILVYEIRQRQKARRQLEDEQNVMGKNCARDYGGHDSTEEMVLRQRPVRS